jgi:hypothetical protein
VAQVGSALALGARGRRFESCQPDGWNQPHRPGEKQNPRRRGGQPAWWDTFRIETTTSSTEPAADSRSAGAGGRWRSVAAALAAVVGVIGVVFGPEVYFDRLAASVGADQDTPPSYSLDAAPVLHCPADPWAEVWWGAGGRAHDLVRGTPTSGLICAYAGLRTHVTAEHPLAAGEVTELTNRLNQLPAVPSGAIDCPNDDGSGFVVILSDGHALTTVSIQRTGCAFVFSRNVASRSDQALLSQLASLAGPRRTIRGSLVG